MALSIIPDGSIVRYAPKFISRSQKVNRHNDVWKIAYQQLRGVVLGQIDDDTCEVAWDLAGVPDCLLYLKTDTLSEFVKYDPTIDMMKIHELREDLVIVRLP
jgi:hypothetical protein